jgi:NADPH2:quinone reductase
VQYGDPNVVKAIRAVAPDGVDLVVEVSPATNSTLNAAVIRNRGCIAVYANNGGDQMVLDVRRHFALNVRYQFLLLYTVGADALAAAGEDIVAALGDNALAVGEEAGLPLHRFDLEHTALAHAAVEAGAVGKVLIDVADAGTFPAS